jgi:hypothetical protein
MEQNLSWETDSHPVSEEIPFLLWNPKVHYWVHKSPPLVPVLSQINPVHTFPLYSLKIHSNIIFSSSSRSSKWSPPFRFSNQNTVRNSYISHASYMTRPSHPPWFDHPNNIWWSVQVTKLLIMQSSPLFRHFLPYLFQKFSSAPCSQTPCPSQFGLSALHVYGYKWRSFSLFTFLSFTLHSSHHHQLQGPMTCSVSITKSMFLLCSYIRFTSWTIIQTFVSDTTVLYSYSMFSWFISVLSNVTCCVVRPNLWFISKVFTSLVLEV